MNMAEYRLNPEVDALIVHSRIRIPLIGTSPYMQVFFNCSSIHAYKERQKS